jgi:SAM-dependent methyltransferase
MPTFEGCMKEKIEASESFAEDWLSYEKRILETQDLLLIPHLDEIKEANKHGDVCDLGCGSGRLTRILKNKTSKTTHGFDINETLLNYARSQGQEGIIFQKLDISIGRIPLADNKCSFIFSNCLMMHLEPSGVKNMLTESFRILNQDGLVFFAVTHHQWANLMYEKHSQGKNEFITTRVVGGEALLEHFRAPKWYCDMFKEVGYSEVQQKDILIPSDVALASRYSNHEGKALFSLFTARK